MPDISEKLGFFSVDGLNNLANKLSTFSLRKLLFGFLGFVVVIFLLLFAYTSLCFLAVRKLPLTKSGLYIFRAPLVSSSITAPFYRSVTSKFLGLFVEKNIIENPYPDYIFPVSGELYSGRFLYFGRAEICGDKVLSGRVCLRFSSGQKLTPVFIKGVSLLVNFSQTSNMENKAFLSKDYQALPEGTKVDVVLQSDTSPQKLLREKEAGNPYFDIREMKVLD